MVSVSGHSTTRRRGDAGSCCGSRANDLFGALYTVALATDMRPVELRALQWKNVDLERGIIQGRATISRDEDQSEQIVARTKRGPGRAVAIGEAVVHKLRWHKAGQAERRLAPSDWQDHGLVFDRGDGHWLYQSQWLRRHKDLCEQADVPAGDQPSCHPPYFCTSALIYGHQCQSGV
jgi:integrase